MSTTPQQAVESITPEFTLFDSNAVSLATFCGTPAAGALLMALNYRRLGKTGLAVTSLLLGLAVTSILLVMAWSLPRAAVSPIALVLLIAIRQIAKSAQGDAVQQHTAKGGRLGSKGLAFGLGLIFLAAIFAVSFAFISLSGGASNGSKVVIGTKDEIYYSGSATKEEALALGKALKENGFLTDRGVSVFLAKGKEGTVISFVAKEAAWNDPAMLSSFEEITREAAPAVGGFPVQLRLIDSEKEVKARSNVGSEALAGGDTVYYYGDIPQTQAHALGVALKTDGFFQGKGVDVFLARHGTNTTMSFVVREGAWEEPALVKGFENAVRDGANAVGGLPVTLRLLTPQLDVKKDEVIQ